MTRHYATPGVYIEEVTGPGIIVGVGTSTAAFIGPALRGPLNTARRITSFDRFIELYGATSGNRPYLFDNGRPYYLAFAVEGFFTNGGREAYIVRVGTADQASLPIQNQDGEDVFIVQALQDGNEGNNIQVQTQQYAQQAVATGTATVSSGTGTTTVTVDHPERFRVGDVVTDGTSRAQIGQIQGNNLHLSIALTGATLRIADIETTQDTFRMVSTAGLYSGGTALISATGTLTTERVVIRTVNTITGFVTLAATPARTTTYSLASTASIPTLTSIRVIVRGQANITSSATITNLAGATVSSIAVSNASPFRPGDIVTSDGTNRAQISRIQGNNLILDQVLAGLGGTLRIADIIPAQTAFRVADTTGLYPGTVILLRGDDANATTPGPTLVEDYVVIQAIDGAGFVTLESTPARTYTYNLNVAAGAEPILIPQEFRLIVTPPPPTTGTRRTERFENLSLNPYHPRYVFNEGMITSYWIKIEQPDAPPTTADYPDQLVTLGGPTNLTGGLDDQPSGLTAVEYQTGLNTLRDVDDVNMVCIPDAASHPERQTIQSAMINHCLGLGERFAVLDSVRGAPPSGPNSVEQQRQRVQATRGFAALYYPWLTVRDPRTRGPRAPNMYVPPSGHMAGIYARTDTERGVHKAPANTEVRGVLGLEKLLSDRQQGPLNLRGINVLRIFPGTAQVTVWGARTTVDPTITDWLYVPIRRLMLYIEESIEEGIRWAVFEPNNLQLWEKLKRTISEFLTRVWRDGALFGETADKAFYVRIDEALNPDRVRALGRLYIEIGVRPSYPAEFIIVRIGLWDGGAEITES